MNKWQPLRVFGLLVFFLSALIFMNPAESIWATEPPPLEVIVINECIKTSFTRTYDWTIDKSVDPDEWHLFAGESGESDYSVGVTRTQTDSDWLMCGTIVIRNTTDQPITITGVEDVLTPANIFAEVTCNFRFPFVLAGGQREGCSFNALLPDGSPQTNTATVFTEDGSSYSKSVDVDFSTASITEVGFPSIHVTDTHGEAWSADSDAIWTYSREFSCPVDESYYQEGVYHYTVDNTATIVETEQSDQAHVDVFCYWAKIDIRKQAEGPDSRTFPIGSDVPFEIVVTNTGVTDLTNVEVTDLEVPDCARFIGDLAVGESFSYTCTATSVLQGFTNIAKVTGQVGDVTVDDEDPSTVEIASIDIRKEAEGPDTRTFPTGSDVLFEIVVTNTGEVDLTNVEVTDELAPDCARSIGDLAVGDSFSYSCTATSVLQGFTNIAKATGQVGDVTVDDEDPSTVEIASIDIRKEAEGPDTRTFPIGSDIPFEIVVTNTGEVDLTNVEVTDELAPDCARSIGDLAVGESFPYTCTVENVTEGFTNIAEVIGEGDGVEVSDEDPSSVETKYVVYLPFVNNGPPPPTKYDVSVGFEDLPIDSLNDFDYNDWLVSIDTDLDGSVIDQENVNLEKLTFQLTPLARGASLDHEFHIMFPAGTFESDGTATLIIRDTNGNPTSTSVTPFQADQVNDFLIFECTCDPLPPSGALVNTEEGTTPTPTQMTAVLMIEFDSATPFEITDFGAHGQGLFFEPYIHVMFGNNPYDVGLDDVRTLVFPILDLPWAEERIRIDNAFPEVEFLGLPEPPLPPQPPPIPVFNFPDGWWKSTNECVYGDGIVCPIPNPLAWLRDRR